jgi:Fe2+ transport system protein FeoA
MTTCLDGARLDSACLDKSEGSVMKLAEAKDGAKLVVTATVGEDVTIQALRFGIGKGAAIEVGKNIPGGPVIVVRNQMELAVGRQLACCIEVSPQVN